MPELDTKYFGRITYGSNSAIEFPVGLLGFENERSFILIEQHVNEPLVFLQSITRPELCFVTLPVRAICADYQLTLSPEDLALLGLTDDWQRHASSEVLQLAVVALDQNGPPTANLLSPLVINWRGRLGIQAIQSDSEYSHRHLLVAETAGASCS